MTSDNNQSITVSGNVYANATIAPTGSGYAYASSCNQLLLYWTSESEAGRSVYTVTSTTTTTDIESAWAWSTSTEPSTPTTCDGVPPILGGETVLGSSYMTTYTTFIFTDTAYVQTTENNTKPMPDCTINQQDCKS